MVIARSKMTAQGQVSVPATVRKTLNADPGSVLEWELKDGAVVVRRAGRFTSEEVHAAVFPSAPRPRRLAELKDGLRRAVRRRHARR